MKILSRKVAGLTVAAGLTIAAASVAGATSASASTAALAKAPLIKATISKHGLTIAGPKTIRPGRVEITLHSAGDESEVQLASFKTGYSYTKLKADIAAFGASEGATGPTAAGLTHLRNAIKHTVLYGGLDADTGKTATMTVVLTTPGHYWLYNDSGDLPAQPRLITVKGSFAHRAAPKIKAVVTATSATRFGGASVLPAHGVITFHNTSTKSPHLLGLIHIKKGTTRKQVIEFLNSGSDKAPPFALAGSAGTDAIGTGRSQTLTLSLPAGTYAELCFFPDPETGMPHALMGMVRIVTLK